MYDVWDYQGQLEDRVRVEAYARALRGAVRPEDVVLDLGCGVGVFAVLAARLGARRVYGVDVSPFVALGPDLAEANGVADRVSWFHGSVEDVTFPEPPTLVVADVRGALPFQMGGLAAWNAALRASPGARTIPRSDRLLAVPLSSDRLHRRARGDGPVEGVSVRALSTALTSHEAPLPGDETLLAEPADLLEMRYDAPHRLPWAARASFTPDRPWTLDGFAVPFRADLAPSVSYVSMGPGAATAYPTPVLLAPRRLEVPAGTPVALRVRVEGEERAPSLLWAVDVGAEEGDWQGRLVVDPVWLDDLRSARPEHVPEPDAIDDLDARILAAFARGESVAAAIASASRELPATPRDRVERRALDLARRRSRRRVRRFGADA